MVVVRFILLLLLTTSVSTFALSVFAHDPADSDNRICAPFRGGVVDPAIVDSMLKASQENRLYRIQPRNSKVGFCVDSSIGRIEARFHGIQGGLALRREVWGDQSQMLVMVDTDSLAMESDNLKKMLKSEYFLDTYTYSKILFVSTKLWWVNQERAILEGKLTMHGVTKPIYFDVRMTALANNDPQSIADLVVTAKSFINRSDFDMSNMTYLVSDEVELCMRIEAALFRK
jgi:polyisoprenoid-binding protein YceI